MQKFFMLLGQNHKDGSLDYRHSGRIYGPFLDDQTREEAIEEVTEGRGRIEEVFLCFEGIMIARRSPAPVAKKRDTVQV